MNSEIKFILAVACLIGCASCVEDFPSNIERCKHGDDDCLVKAWNKWMKVAYTSGVPELDLPMSDAHHLDKEVFSIGSNLLTLKITFRNITVRGIGQATVTGVKGFKKDVKQMESFKVSAFVPYVNFIAPYEGSGKLLLLQVTGSGRGEIHLYNTTCEVTIFTKFNTVDGEDYLVPAKVLVDFKSEKYGFLFENILNSKEISDNINKLVNENDQLFGAEVHAPASKSFSRIVKKALTPIFKKYPYRSFFLD